MSGDKISITLSELAHSKVKHWVNKKNEEVSGFGTTSYTKDDTGFHVYVHDVYLLEQEVGAAHTDIDAGSMAKLMHKVLVNPETRSLKLNFWWHSHVKMETFWSSTDLDTIKSIGRNGLCIATVFNQHGKMRSAICYKNTSEVFGEGSSFIDDVKTYYETKPEDPRIPEWNAEFEENVKEKKYEAYTRDAYDQYPMHQGNLLSSSYGVDERKFIDPRDLEDATNHGLLGFGVEEEARVLDMKVKKYIKILRDNDRDTINGIEKQLEMKWEAGLLNG